MDALNKTTQAVNTFSQDGIKFEHEVDSTSIAYLSLAILLTGVLLIFIAKKL